MAAYKYPFANATESDKRLVWDKGIAVSGYSASDWRKDKCGKMMQYSQHGNRDSQYGWEIDHVYPQSKGGSHQLSNLQPLNWQNNSAKGDTYPWNCGR